MDFCLYSTFFIMLIRKNIQMTDVKDSFWNRMIHLRVRIPSTWTP